MKHAVCGVMTVLAAVTSVGTAAEAVKVCQEFITADPDAAEADRFRALAEEMAGKLAPESKTQ